MTTYRHPYSRKPRPDKFRRPPLAHWIVNSNPITRTQKRSVEYWTQMYWATPPWLNEKQILRMKLTWESANPRFEHLDHIVPLKHELVCGLNVPWNIQKLPWRENIAKSNLHWPDCPDHLCPVLNLPVDMFAAEKLPHQMRLNL